MALKLSTRATRVNHDVNSRARGIDEAPLNRFPMKKHLAALALWLAGLDPLWRMLRPVARVFLQLSRKRERVESERLIEASAAVSLRSQVAVLNGPFSGMCYPSPETVMSAYYPKILGCYEAELHPTLLSLRERDYQLIVDIGCAEGYYAVGLGLLFPKARVHAFDTDSRALELCREMALRNGLGERLETGSHCSQQTLVDYDFPERSLLFCDCEGYEAELFTRHSLNNLVTCDLIIETHDHLCPGVSSTLIERFNETHSCRRICTYDDLQKLYLYRFPETDSLPHEVRTALFREWRYTHQEWLVLRAR
jgi:hypothetical protein